MNHRTGSPKTREIELFKCYLASEPLREPNEDPFLDGLHVDQTGQEEQEPHSQKKKSDQTSNDPDQNLFMLFHRAS